MEKFKIQNKGGVQEKPHLAKLYTREQKRKINDRIREGHMCCGMRKWDIEAKIRF